MAAEGQEEGHLDSDTNNFSFLSAQPRSDTPTVAGGPSQEPSLTTLDPATQQQIEHASATAGLNAQDGDSLADREGQEPSLLHVADAGQEPSLMHSSAFGEGSLVQQDAEVGSTANHSAEQIEGHTAAPLEQPEAARNSSAEQQQPSSTDPPDSATDGSAAVAVVDQWQQKQQQPLHQPQDPGGQLPGELPSQAPGDSQKSVTAAAVVVGTSPAAPPQQAMQEATPLLAVDAAPGNSRQFDSKPYFVDGIRAIDVEVDCGPGMPCRLLHVTMDVSSLQQNPKPFLGGYRHKHSGAIYHHATCQTPKAPNQGSKTAAAAAAAAGAGGEGSHVVRERLSRETQTIKAAATSCQTVREAATQMGRPGLELDCSGDRQLTPRPYTTAAAVEQRRSDAALTIQRHCRGWMARQRAAALQAIKAERDGFLAEAAAERDAAAAAQRKREVERRTHPLSHSDFALLSSELETWRQQQTAAIKAAAQQAQPEHGFDEQAALQLLLAKETRLLQTLDRLRVNAKGEVKARKTDRLLNNLSQPKTWTLSNGKKVMVHTPTTVRAAELQQLHRGLTLPGLTLDERLDVLLHVKWAVKEFDCALTREIVELIDREADLLNRGRSPKTLDGLRRRIAGAFLAFCQTPAFNPEAARLQLVPSAPNEPEMFEYVEECVDEGVQCC